MNKKLFKIKETDRKKKKEEISHANSPKKSEITEPDLMNYQNYLLFRGKSKNLITENPKTAEKNSEKKFDFEEKIIENASSSSKFEIFLNLLWVFFEGIDKFFYL